MDFEFPDTDTKFNTVIEKNTYYLQNMEFEEEYDSYIYSVINNLLALKNEVEKEGGSLNQDLFVEHIITMEEGLDAILILTGFSEESFQRLITFIRSECDEELGKIVYIDKWPEDEQVEWKLRKIKDIAKNNEHFAKGLINIFFKGCSSILLRNKLPNFELKKLDMRKLSFSTESLLDTVIRYKIKGSYSGKMRNNAEIFIKQVLENMECPFEQGKLENVGRNLDFIIPNKESPKIIIESTYLVTTSSGMGDKAKTEQKVCKDIKNHYPDAIFVGFVDGVGWYVRRGDLKRMVKAHDFVFTFRNDEIEKFRELLESLVG